MKLELKDFQQSAVRELLNRIEYAKLGVQRSLPQAVVLASPTGSGKTVISTRLIEVILGADDSEEEYTFTPEPDAVFLWLSDQPELNEQSRKKMVETSTRLNENSLVIVDTDFDQEAFTGGKVYFLNIQKLSRTSLLTTGHGDKRNFTIWQTITNTAKRLKDKFYLIIDEAHRGTRYTRNDISAQKTILQKFILGADEIPAIDLVLGISATPQRFVDLLQNQTSRTPQTHEIKPDQIRSSGLLKDRIMLFHPADTQPSDWTLLAEAARHWRCMRDAWNAYTAEQSIPLVHPAMVIQTEDGDVRSPAFCAKMAEALRVLESVLGPIKDDELAHSFQEDFPVDAGSHKIRKIEASRIQEETSIKFIFFKMALTTGWDCPRAEVMMSFRRAQDDTLIAQLIGRMVRTPLARRIEGREELNTVSLYLPHYDKEGLERVVNHLKTDPDAVPPTDVEDGAKMVTFRRDPDAADAFAALAGLPTYRVERVRKISNVRRMMNLAYLLTMKHGIDPEAYSEVKKLVINTLDAEVARLRGEDAQFDTKLDSFDEITINAVAVEQGTWQTLPGQPVKVLLDDKNVEELFNKAGARLGFGLHLDYWQARADLANPNRARLELFMVMQNDKAWEALEKAAAVRIAALLKAHKPTIRTLTTSEQEEYNKVQEVAKTPEALEFLAPMEIMVAIDPTDATVREYNKHLFLDTAGRFRMKSTEWERQVVESEAARVDVIGWLRNYERKPWALALPYDYLGAERPMYPDFLIVRRIASGLEVDILEPHSPHLADSYAKAKGLAQFAAKHMTRFGRIELIRVEGSDIRRLDLIDAATRQNVLKVGSNAGLDLVFGLGQ